MTWNHLIRYHFEFIPTMFWSCGKKKGKKTKQMEFSMKSDKLPQLKSTVANTCHYIGNYEKS